MHRSWPFLAVALPLLLALPAGAQSGKDAVDQVVALLASPNTKISRSALFEGISKHVDFADMSEQIVGTTIWGKLAPARKEEFQTLVQQLVEQRYYPRWHKLFAKGKLAFYGETAANKDTFVRTGLTVGKKRSELTWRLRQKDGQLSVLSLSVGKRDLLGHLHTRFKKHLDQKGFDETVAWLKDKVDDEDVDSDIAGHIQTH